MSMHELSRRAGRLIHSISAYRPGLRSPDDPFVPAADEHGQEIAGIESLREELLRSTETISDYHFGSGRPLRSGVTTIAHECRHSALPAKWCVTLFRCARKRKPLRCLELGTNLGLSTAYLATALKLNGAGHLVSVEGSPSLAERARKNLAQLGLTNVEILNEPFESGLLQAIERLGTVDLAFVDGHHDEVATKAYAGQLVPACSPGALLVFDDIRWSPGMARAWKEISNDASVTAVYDLYEIGAVVVGGSGSLREVHLVKL